MDKTKKYTLVFIIGCFLIIGVGGITQLFTPTSSKEDTSKIVEKDNQQEVIKEEEKDDAKQSIESKDSKSSSEKTDTKKQTTNSKDKAQKKEPEKNNDSNSSSTEKKEEIDEKSHVQLTIKGIDSTITSANVEIIKDDTVYDVLKQLTSSKGIELRTSGPSSIIYIRGINGLNEFEHGPKSGWKYKVNNVYPSKSAGAFKVEDGDQIEWIYTIDG